jgi:hypothetical protein
VLANHLRGERRHSIRAAVLRDELTAAPAVAAAPAVVAIATDTGPSPAHPGHAGVQLAALSFPARGSTWS